MVCIIIFLPMILLLFNVAGYLKLDTDIYSDVNSNDFNILTFKGMGKGIEFIIDLGKFTVGGLGWFWISFFSAIELIMFGVLILMIRGVT